MWQAQNVTPYPHPPPLRTRRASDCEIAYNTCSGRLSINQNPLQGHLWSYSMESLNKESEFEAPVLTWAQKRSDLREKSTVGKFVRSSLQGLNHEDVLLKLETKIINNGKGHARASAHGLRAIMETMLHGSQFYMLFKEAFHIYGSFFETMFHNVDRRYTTPFGQVVLYLWPLCFIVWVVHNVDRLFTSIFGSVAVALTLPS